MGGEGIQRPSGEYCGEPSQAELLVSFLASPPATGAIQTSLFVLKASSLSTLRAKASSRLSGEKLYSAPPPRKGGTLASPGVRSRAAPPSTGRAKTWLGLPSDHATQWRSISRAERRP